MKKRVLALILCLIICLVFMISCGETDYDKSKEYLESHQKTPEKEYVTLNLYLPAAGAVDASTVSAMQTEFNRIIEPKYRTRVVFHLIDSTDPAVSYRDLIAEKANLSKERADAGVKDKTTPLLGEKFPQEGESQFDMFVSLDLTMLQSMLAGEYVADVTAPLKNKYPSVLKNEMREDISITSVIYNNAVIDGKYYGVPANFMIGNYTYDVFDAVFYEKYYGKGTVDENRIVTGVTADDLTELEDKPEYASSHIRILPSSTNRVTYAMRYVLGERADIASWSNYVVVVSDTPSLTYEELFMGMYCISSTCAYQDRALEVIAELYTNPLLHTTLQYGASNVTYKLSETEGGSYVVTPIEGAPFYQIDTRYTGNILTVYPTAETVIGSSSGFTPYAVGPDFAKYAILQNKEAKYSSSSN